MTELPNGYSKALNIDLQKNKRLAVLVNVTALFIMAVMIIAAVFFIPFKTFFNTDNILIYVIRFLVVWLGMVAYIFLHELVHGIFMKHFSGVKPHYGFTGLYAYAGSSAYFDRKQYIIIALAPIAILGIILLMINCIVPKAWFWVIYIIQITNISGAAGDIYVTYKMLRLPATLLVNNTGVSMTVYTEN